MSFEPITITSEDFARVLELPAVIGYGQIGSVGCAACKLETACGATHCNKKIGMYDTSKKLSHNWGIYLAISELENLGLQHDAELARAVINNLTVIKDQQYFTASTHPELWDIHVRFLRLMFQKAEELGLIKLEDVLSKEFAKEAARPLVTA